MRPPPPEPVKIGAYPRDLPRHAHEADRGVALVFAPDVDDSPAARLELGDMDVQSLDYPVDSVFTVRVTAGHGVEDHEATWRFRVTGDEADVAHHTVGPGLTVERGRWGRRSFDGFEFGVLVMCAVLLDD